MDDLRKKQPPEVRMNGLPVPIPPTPFHTRTYTHIHAYIHTYIHTYIYIHTHTKLQALALVNPSSRPGCSKL